MFYKFRQYSIDVSNFRLLESGKIVAVEPQVFDLIVYLIQNRQRLVSRQEILNALWQEKEVSDTTLSNHLKIARKVLGDNGQLQKVIKTFHGRGYQFIAKIEESTTQRSELHSKIKRSSKYLILILFALISITFYWSIDSNNIDLPPEENTSIQLIAVLPFANTHPDPETDFYGFAIADQIIGELAYLQNVAVKASSTIRKYENKISEPQVIGKELGVDYVLVGNYLKIDNDFRLSIELIEVSTNQMVWRGKPISVKSSNIFELQDLVAQQVIKNLRIKFSDQELKRINRNSSQDSLAYEYYLRGIAFPRTSEGNRLAIKVLQKAIEIDPQFAPAYVRLGDRIHRYEQYGLVNSGPSHETVKLYRQALSINPELMSALTNLAYLYTETNRIEEAMELIIQTLEINPNYANSHFALGYIYRYAGMNDEAIIEMKKAVTIDPKDIGFRTLANTYAGIGRYDEALEFLKRYPESPFTIGMKGSINYSLGNYDLAVKYYDQSIQMEPGGLWALVAIIHKVALTDDYNEGLYAIHQLEQTNVTDAEAVYYIANYYGILNDKKRCIQALKKAVDGGYFNYYILNNNPNLKKFKDDPEFKKVLEQARQRHLTFRKRFFDQ